MRNYREYKGYVEQLALEKTPTARKR